MVQISPDAEKFINDLLEKNQKVGYGIKIYLSGFACSGPQFGMSFQEKANEGENIDKSANGFDMFYDDETKKELEEYHQEPQLQRLRLLRRRMPLNEFIGGPTPILLSLPHESRPLTWRTLSIHA